jgi:hypothetical protein
MRPYGYEHGYNKKMHWQEPWGSKSERRGGRKVMKKLARNTAKNFVKKEENGLTEEKNEL